MIVFTILCMVCCAVAIFLLVISLRLNVKLDERLEAVCTQVEESLDIIDDCYGRIVKASETPVMSDEPVVRQLLNDVVHVKHAVLLIARKIVQDQDKKNDDNGLELGDKRNGQG